jgi:ribosomal protein S27E
MKTVREKILHQIILQEKMQSLANVNLVTCGNCGSILLHETNEEQIDCFACGNMISQSDCPDYWYKGIENNQEFN